LKDTLGRFFWPAALHRDASTGIPTGTVFLILRTSFQFIMLYPYFYCMEESFHDALNINGSEQLSFQLGELAVFTLI
jgi:hypothetical protein